MRIHRNIARFIEYRDTDDQPLDPDAFRLALMIATRSADGTATVVMGLRYVAEHLGSDADPDGRKHDAAARAGREAVQSGLIERYRLNDATNAKDGPGAVYHWRVADDDGAPLREPRWGGAFRSVIALGRASAEHGRESALLARLMFAADADGGWSGDREQLLALCGLDRRTADKQLKLLHRRAGSGLRYTSGLVEVDTPKGLRRKLRYFVKVELPAVARERHIPTCCEDDEGLLAEVWDRAALEALKRQVAALRGIELTPEQKRECFLLPMISLQRWLTDDAFPRHRGHDDLLDRALKDVLGRDRVLRGDSAAPDEDPLKSWWAYARKTCRNPDHVAELVQTLPVEEGDAVTGDASTTAAAPDVQPQQIAPDQHDEDALADCDDGIPFEQTYDGPAPRAAEINPLDPNWDYLDDMDPDDIPFGTEYEVYRARRIGSRNESGAVGAARPIEDDQQPLTASEPSMTASHTEQPVEAIEHVVQTAEQAGLADVESAADALISQVRDVLGRASSRRERGVSFDEQRMGTWIRRVGSQVVEHGLASCFSEAEHRLREALRLGLDDFRGDLYEHDDEPPYEDGEVEAIFADLERRQSARA